MIKTNLTGEQLLNNAALNKGTAFTTEERQAFALYGKLPSSIETLDMQTARAYQQYQTQSSNALKNRFLHELYVTNQTLFYKLVRTHLEAMLPVLYTPNVADAVTSFSQEFRRPEGLYLSYPERDHLREILDTYDPNLIGLLVVTDGERVLGIGDQGIGAVHIAIAKSMLYSLLGNINPLRVLPIVLDVGTNNQKLLDDPMYLGWRHERLSGQQYINFIDFFVDMVRQKFPHVMLHWEDFGRDNAAFVLERYQQKICSFNDDIQGTAIVTVAALLNALKSTGQDWATQRIVIFGAGAAGTGIANQIVKAMQYGGLKTREICGKLWLIDKQGLLTTTSTQLTPAQQPFVHSSQDIIQWRLKNKNFISLVDVVTNLKPTVLIGCSTQKDAFNENIVRAMAQYTPYPIIFPLSNPNEKCEATPENLIKWTDGRAIITTGSPFAPVVYKNKAINIAQCNNALMFPGVGLGVLAAKATQLTDAMLWAACETLLTESSNLSTLLPPLDATTPKLAIKIAYAVATKAYEEGFSQTINNQTDVMELIQQQTWTPHYKNIIFQNDVQ